MAVYVPTAAVGNGKVLVTLGGAGEIMSFFYPNIDFAQNVRQLLSAVYIGDPGHGRFRWTFDGEFQSHQEYVRRSNVLQTVLRLPSERLQISFRDFCPPDAAALVRRVEIQAPPDAGFRGSLLKYFELHLQEVQGKQSVSYVPERSAVVQYFRDVAIAVGGEPPTVWRCGKSIDEGPRSAKSDLYDGHLNGQAEDIGQVDFALGWQVTIPPGATEQFDIIIAAAPTRKDALGAVHSLGAVGAATLERDAVEQDALWLAQHAEPDIADPFLESYQRALLSLRILQDEKTSAVIAAPEFDPAYEMCGGYGYCWPRDATEAVEALADAGNAGPRRALSEWYIGAQLSSGHWGQRYWSDAKLASSWATREDFMQVDQTAAALIALCRDVMAADPHLRSDRLERAWRHIRTGAEALAAMVSPQGWHSLSCGLWETFCATFVYTNAAIWSALSHCARIADLNGNGELAEQWRHIAGRMKKATLASHNGEHFPRGLTQRGEFDYIVDSATMGVLEPFGMISLEDHDERKLMETNVAVIEDRLGYELGSATGIRRYEGDDYLGGVIGCVNTLWLALVQLQLAQSYQGEDEERSDQLRRRAERYMGFCLEHTTPTGLFGELIRPQPSDGYWAAPHSWASALSVKCALQLDGLRRHAASASRRLSEATRT